MFVELFILIFGDDLYSILLTDYPVLLGLFSYLVFLTILLCFSYFVKNAIGGFR